MQKMATSTGLEPATLRYSSSNRRRTRYPIGRVSGQPDVVKVNVNLHCANRPLDGITVFAVKNIFYLHAGFLC